MNQTKVVRTLRLLESREYQLLKDFAAGHCRREKALALLDLLLAGIRSKQPPKLSRAYILTALAKATESTAEELNLTDLSSDVKRLAERYLVWKQIVADRRRLTPKGQLLLLEPLADDYDLFEDQCHQLSRRLEKAPHQHSQYFYLLHRLRHQSYFRNEHNYYLSGMELLAESQRALDVYYLIHRYRYRVEDLCFRSLLRTDEPIPEGLTTLAEKYADIPAIQLYRQVIRLLDQFEEAIYSETKAFYTEHFRDLDELDRHNLFQKFLIILNRAYEAGQSELLREIFDLYRFADRQGLLLYKNRITSITYLNVVTIGAYLGENDWTEDFVSRHLPHLLPDERPAIKQLAYAYLAYFRQDYAEAQRLNLELKRREHTSTTIRSRILDFWLYYRDPDYDRPFLERTLDNFRKYLENRQDLGKGRKVAFYNFVGLARRLVSLDSDPDELAELHTRITQCPPPLRPLLVIGTNQRRPGQKILIAGRERRSRIYSGVAHGPMMSSTPTTWFTNQCQ